MEHLVRRRMLSALVVTVLVAGCGGSAGSPPPPPGSAGTDPAALPDGPGSASAEPTSPIPPAASATPAAGSSPTPPPTPAVVLASGKVARSEVARAGATTARAKEAAASITSFGIDLYQQMLADGTLDAEDNAVFSPTSIALALGMARAGAKGATADQMDAVLHTTGWGALGKGLNALEQALSSRNATWKARSDPTTAVEGTRSLTLRIANAAFAQRNWAIVREYLDRIGATFGAGLRLVDYEANPEASRKAINAWVKKRTAGRIPELIPREPPMITPLTRLVLVNAIYLKAEWQIELSDARPRAFTRLDGSSDRVATMGLWGGQAVPYATGKGWQATELRYNAADRKRPLALTLVLPGDLAAFEEGLTAAKIGRIVAKLDAERVLLRRVSRPARSSDDCLGGMYAYSLQLFMPRFGVDTAAALKRPLTALGMPLAFERGVADFTGIHVPESPDELLYVGEVVHQANIDVDENGTEAAAATAVIDVSTTGGCYDEPRRVITLRLNRPFLFLLRDVETGAILFMGRVVDPLQE